MYAYTETNITKLQEMIKIMFAARAKTIEMPIIKTWTMLLANCLSYEQAEYALEYFTYYSEDDFPSVPKIWEKGSRMPQKKEFKKILTDDEKNRRMELEFLSRINGG